MRKKNSKSKYKNLWEWFISIPSMREIALKTPLPLLIIFGLIYVLFSIFSFLSLNHSNFSADDVIGSSITFILGIFTIIFASKDIQFLCQQRKGYKLLDISDWIELMIKGSLSLIIIIGIGIVITLFIF